MPEGSNLHLFIFKTTIINNYNKLNMFKGVLYFKFESITSRVFGPLLRSTGQNLFR